MPQLGPTPWEAYQESGKILVTVDIYDGELKPLVHREVRVDPPIDLEGIQERSGRVAQTRIGKDVLVVCAEWPA